MMLALVLATGGPGLAAAQNNVSAPLITAPIDESRTVHMVGNTRPEANAQNDRGRVSDLLPLGHLQLLLRRPTEREQALQRYIDQIHDRRSPNYHRWLTSRELAQRYGPASSDLTAIIGWLSRHGFTVNTTYPGSMIIDFSGTAGQIRSTFHCEIHALDVQGVRHIANLTDPQIPASLAPAVQGIVSLHDFRPHAMRIPRAQYSTSGPEFLLAPADIATLYNLTPVFQSGNTGQGQTIVVIEDTDVYSTTDWTTFRSTFGLTGSPGGFTQVHPPAPSGPNNCTDPGVGANGVDGEAILDAEWASAAAPGAIIELASCHDSGTTFGGLIALQNLLNASTTPPAIFSISYGECEALNGAAANAAYVSTYQEAVAEGVSVFVAAGDDGAAACDPKATAATHGIGVSGFASTPYNVAVGGTDFGDTYAGTQSSYWSSTNSATFGSALSYVPEIPWNDSCAGTLLANYYGYGVGYGTSGFCNNSPPAEYLTTVAGSGGPSGCATGSPAKKEVVGGSCTGTPKPSWQTGSGVPSDGVRDLPDVALFAGNGIWAHYYVFCWSDASASGGEPCTGPPSGWSGAGGTSFAAPIMAGIQALVNQSSGGRQGNPNYVYYTLASSQGAAATNCDATEGNALATTCVFHDVTRGDMDVNCQRTNSCYLTSGTYGVLSTSSSSDVPAFAAAPGWDFATGLGSVNASNLVNAWSSADLALSGSGSVVGGEPSYTLVVGDSGPQAASSVQVQTTLPSGMSLVAAQSSSGCLQSGQAVICVVGGLAQGATKTLVVVIQPGAAETANLTFTASSSQGDLDLNNNVVALSVNLPNGTAGDGPLPLWAIAALGALLMLVTAWRTPTGNARRS
jgi:uncharacterized repeat protein (TIGR01451 family)